MERDTLTETGRQMARLPVDPRIARMIIESGRQGCAREILVIAAALSIQDPRERPTDNQQAADTAHRRFTQPESDFVAFVALWDYLAEKQRELTGSAFRRLCRAEFLNYLRVREWQDLHAQLSSLARELGINSKSSSSERTLVHTSLLAGLLSHVGMKMVLPATRSGGPGAGNDRTPGERGRRPLPEYLGARGTKFAVFPGSGLAKKPPDWIVAAELVETSRLWGRTVAAIEPEWVEPIAAHLVKRSYSEPRWSRSLGAAVATEKVTLYGIPIIADRQLLLAKIDPVLARELFIRHALVEGDWQTRHHFFRDNTALIEQAAELEQRARRRGLVAGEDALFEFYDARVPADATSARHFDAWWKKARHQTPDLLTLTLDDLLSDAAADLDADAFPQMWTSSSPSLAGSGSGSGGPAGLTVSYTFEPGHDADGVTIDIPLKTLNQASPEEFSWQIPGLRLELVTELIRSLPKTLRRELVPAPDLAREILAGFRRRRSRPPTSGRPSPASCCGCAACGSRLTSSTSTSSRRTCGSPSGSWTARRSSRRARTSPRSSASSAPRSAPPSPPAPPRSPAPASPAGISGRCRRSSPTARSRPTRPWSTPAPRSTSGCSRPPPRPGGPCAPEPGGWCC